MNCPECKERLYPDNPEIGYADFRTKRYFPPLCQGCPNEYDKGIEYRLEELNDRIDNIEAISAQPGRIPRQYHDKLQQLQGQVLNLKGKFLDLEQLVTSKGSKYGYY